jgi:hypothetical protein
VLSTAHHRDEGVFEALIPFPSIFPFSVSQPSLRGLAVVLLPQGGSKETATNQSRNSNGCRHLSPFWNCHQSCAGTEKRARDGVQRYASGGLTQNKEAYSPQINYAIPQINFF